MVNIKFNFGECEITKVYFEQEITNTDFRENLPRELTECEIARLKLKEQQKQISSNKYDKYQEDDYLDEFDNEFHFK